MTIEGFIIGYLAGRLSVSVTGSVPHPLPEEFVTVEKTGGGKNNQVAAATLAIQSWSSSRAAAAALNEAVKAAMEAAVALPEIGSVQLNSDYNYTDTTMDKPRYQAVFDVVHYVIFEED